MSIPETFFRQVYERYLLAAEKNGERVVSLSIGEKAVRFHFASSILQEVIMPAFQHLVFPASEVRGKGLDIYLWDSRTTDVPMIQRPWGESDFLPRGGVKGFSNQRIRTAYQPDRDALSILDVENNKAIYWVPDAKLVPYFETGAPLLGILPQWFLEQGKIVVHGGAIGLGDQGALLVGRGGSGKSTTVLNSLSRQDIRYIGDDYCLAEVDAHVRTHSLYCSAKVQPELVDLFPHLRPTLRNGEQLPNEKALYILHPLLSYQLTQTLSIGAILIPRISVGQKTAISPASAKDGFKALAPSTLLQLPGLGNHAFTIIAEVVRNLPVYHLDLGSDYADVLDVLYRFLNKL